MPKVTYVIGSCLLSAIRPQILKKYTEHMEEDEETTKAIPPWVELEYAVSRDA